MGAIPCSQADHCPPCCARRGFGSDVSAEYMPQNFRQANREHLELGTPFAAAQATTTFRGSISHPALGGEQSSDLIVVGRGAGIWQRGGGQPLPVEVDVEGPRMVVKELHSTLVGVVTEQGLFHGEVLVDGVGGGIFSLSQVADGESTDSRERSGAAGSTAAGQQASPPDSSPQAFGQEPLLEEALLNESYFARELQELARLPDAGPDGERPRFDFKTGASYKGQWKGNRRHGMGTQVWADGASFTGMWNNNFAEGLGKFTHADGDVFMGQWQKSAAQGLGTYCHKNGLTVYCGEWVEDLQHGYGVERCEGGSEYRGNFCRGKKEGFGVYTWPDGSMYSGQWSGNSINGYGHYAGKDGRQFQGMWREAVIHGCGKYLWPDGRTFWGQYVDDKKDGLGIFIWKDGRRFEGFWAEGKQHGFGTIFKPNGEVMKSGMWVMGKPPETPEESPEVMATAGVSPMGPVRAPLHRPQRGS